MEFRRIVSARKIFKTRSLISLRSFFPLFALNHLEANVTFSGRKGKKREVNKQAKKGKERELTSLKLDCHLLRLLNPSTLNSPRKKGVSAENRILFYLSQGFRRGRGRETEKCTNGPREWSQQQIILLHCFSLADTVCEIIAAILHREASLFLPFLSPRQNEKETRFFATAEK